jgi:hypothetical protein
MREGQFVLISGLSTSAVSKNAAGERTWWVNGSTECGTEIVNSKQEFRLLLLEFIRAFTLAF